MVLNNDNFLFSTQEVLDIARAAEQGTAAKNSHKRRHPHPPDKELSEMEGRVLENVSSDFCCEVTSSYATTPLLFEQRGCCLNNAPTKIMRGDYVAVCIYQFHLFISDKNKHEVSDQTYNCPHNNFEGDYKS
ncbi:hypothetical protein M433DRAFT_9288 [Acidomyces richmondensis BFW]|nr:hypothetical protein M433DRAFT_9288 [Acidomyces richmondensis BFW]